MLRPEQVKAGRYVILLNYDHLFDDELMQYREIMTLNNAYKIIQCHEDGKLFYILDDNGDAVNFIHREYKSFKLLEEPNHEETV